MSERPSESSLDATHRPIPSPLRTPSSRHRWLRLDLVIGARVSHCHRIACDVPGIRRWWRHPLSPSAQNGLSPITTAEGKEKGPPVLGPSLKFTIDYRDQGAANYRGHSHNAIARRSGRKDSNRPDSWNQRSPRASAKSRTCRPGKAGRCNRPGADSFAVRTLRASPPSLRALRALRGEVIVHALGLAVDHALHHAVLDPRDVPVHEVSEQYVQEMPEPRGRVMTPCQTCDAAIVPSFPEIIGRGRFTPENTMGVLTFFGGFASSVATKSRSSSIGMFFRFSLGRMAWSSGKPGVGVFLLAGRQGFVSRAMIRSRSPSKAGACTCMTSQTMSNLTASNECATRSRMPTTSDHRT